MSRRVGRYTKIETTKLIRMFDEGYSIYKICRNLNRSQKSIRNNLIRLNLIEGDITPRRYKSKLELLEINDSKSINFFNIFFYLTVLSVLSFLMLINPLLNPVQVFFEWILIIILRWSKRFFFKI